MEERISSIEKAILVLELLCTEPYSFSVTQISNLTNINRTTIYRILETLEEKNLIIRNKDTKEVKIGPSIYHMGCTYLNNSTYEEKVLEILNKIAQETKESVGFAKREGNAVISLYEIEINQPMKMNYRPGNFYPINRGCYGKCLMAYHDPEIVEELLGSNNFEKICTNTLTKPKELKEEYKKIRHQEYVISDCEVSPYAIGVGVPIFNQKNEVNFCVAVSFIKAGNYKEKIKQQLSILQRYAPYLSKYVL